MTDIRRHSGIIHRVRQVTYERYINERRLYQFPHVFVFDVTDYDPNTDFSENPVWDTLGHYRAQRGPHSCVPQAPAAEYMFLASVGREYHASLLVKPSRKYLFFFFLSSVIGGCSSGNHSSRA